MPLVMDRLSPPTGYPATEMEACSGSTRRPWIGTNGICAARLIGCGVSAARVVFAVLDHCLACAGSVQKKSFLHTYMMCLI
jgi:hypothetical protein